MGLAKIVVPITITYPLLMKMDTYTVKDVLNIVKFVMIIQVVNYVKKIIS